MPKSSGFSNRSSHRRASVVPHASGSGKIASWMNGFPEVSMSLLPHRFLFRVAYPCRYVKGIPAEEGDRLLELPESCRIEDFAAIDAL